jgi:protein SCO1/2
MKLSQIIFSALFFANAAMAAELPGSSVYQLHSQWTDQNNVTRSFSQLAGRPRLIAMVFTRCPSACPLLVRDIKSLKTDLPVELFSFDSEGETPATLKDFVRKYGIDDPRWTAHTSSAANVAELAAALGVKYKKISQGSFIHANIIVLVNSQGEIVAKQEGFDANADFLKALNQIK